MFADPLGAPITPDRLSRRFRELRESAGVPVGTLHTLRRTAATLALTSGVPVHIVAARLGDDPTTVLKTYAHLLPSSDEIAAERVAAVVSGWLPIRPVSGFNSKSSNVSPSPSPSGPIQFSGLLTPLPPRVSWPL